MIANQVEGNLKRTSGNSLSPLGVQNKDLCAASQTVLIIVKLSSARRLEQLLLSQDLFTKKVKDSCDL